MRDEAYLAYIRQHSCLVCEEVCVDAHHVESGGMATKGSDYSTVPLCRTHHSEYHYWGKMKFECTYPWTKIEYSIIQFLQNYIVKLKEEK